MALTRTWKLKDLDCADCAAKVEHAVAAVDGVSSAQVNFMQMKMTVTADAEKDESFWTHIEQVAGNAEEEMQMRVMENGVCPFCGHKHCTCALEEKEDEDEEEAHSPKSIILSAVLFALSLLLSRSSLDKPLFSLSTGFTFHFSSLLALVSYLVCGWSVLVSALRNLAKGKMLDEHFLMAVASIGAIVLSDFREAAAVMLFYQIGEYFQDKAVDSSRRNIAGMLDLKSDSATVVDKAGEHAVPCEEVQVGQIVKVKNGEKIPLDGIIVEGDTYLDTKSITGEPVPRHAGVGDAVVSGTVNTSSVIKIKVMKPYEDSTVSKIMEMVEDSSSRKAKSEQFITRFSRVYTPSVVAGAALLSLIGSLLTHEPSVWIYRALTFLVISCPCALVISIPLAYFSGIGSLARAGVMAKGGNYVQTLAETKTVVFDKTGTLTSGTFTVQKCDTFGMEQERMLDYAASLEKESDHPVAKAIEAYHPAKTGTTNAREIAGKGIIGTLDGHEVLCGNRKLLEERQVAVNGTTSEGGTSVLVAVDGRHVGTILVADTVKPGVKATLSTLKTLGIRHLVMLTGDAKANAEATARDIGIDTVRSELLPQDKVAEFKRLKAEGGKTAYVGDGINDAPVLGLSDVGIAMGALGSDAAVESADIVMMTDDFKRIGTTFKIAKATSRVVHENIAFSLTVKGLALLFGALGIAGMWMAIFADVGVAMLAILNSLRLLAHPKD